MALETPIAASPDRRPTLDTGVWVDALALSERHVTRLRAEPHRSPAARDEHVSALVAGECAAPKAPLATGRSFVAYAALLTRLDKTAIRERRSGASEQVGVFSPERVVGDRMAATAEDQQVVEGVRRFVVGEQNERPDMVDSDVGRCAAGALAPVALDRCAFLAGPTRASVTGKPTSPCRILFARPRAGSSQPRRETRPRAEARLLFDERFSAFLTNLRGCLAHG